MYICGQHFSSKVVKEIQRQISMQPDISMRQLSRKVCEQLSWRGISGEWQEGGCRKALAKLKKEGVLSFPLPQRPSIKRDKPALIADQVELVGNISSLGKIFVNLVENYQSDEAKLWRSLMEKHHYLRDKPLCGAQLKYLVSSERHGVIAAFGFQSGCYSLASRDKAIGWSEAARMANISFVVNNSRFLILPHVKIANLASHLLGLMGKILPNDWQGRYQVKPLLLETFINPQLFSGTCYRAANWQEVGESSGRRTDGVAKRILLYPLQDDWQSQLCQEPVDVLREVDCSEEDLSWAEKEFYSLRLADRRIKQRLCKVAEDFFHNPVANIPEACGSNASIIATYRLLQNPKLKMETILTPHVEATVNRIKQYPVVLAPQDTTTLNYSALTTTEGLGSISTSGNTSVGLILHDTLAFTPDGNPLGVLDAQCWARDPENLHKSKQRKELPIDQKESVKWLRSYRKLAEIQKLCPDTILVSVGDRESDIFELLTEASLDSNGPKILLRAERTRNRLVKKATKTSHENNSNEINQEEHLWQHVTQQPVAGEVTLHIPRRSNRAARNAQLQVRYSHVEISPRKGKKEAAITLWVVHLFEPKAADGRPGLEWMLMTTVPVNNFADAVERSEWYAARWGIEVFHRTLKSGCRIEDRQLGDADRLENCLAIDMIVAWRVYHLTMLGREKPNHPCTEIFTELEWKALYCLSKKTAVMPKVPPTISESINMLAGLGGYAGGKNSMPGTQVIWRGLVKHAVATEVYEYCTVTRPTQGGP